MDKRLFAIMLVVGAVALLSAGSSRAVVTRAQHTRQAENAEEAPDVNEETTKGCLENVATLYDEISNHHFAGVDEWVRKARVYYDDEKAKEIPEDYNPRYGKENSAGETPKDVDPLNYQPVTVPKGCEELNNMLQEVDDRVLCWDIAHDVNGVMQDLAAISRINDGARKTAERFVVCHTGLRAGPAMKNMGVFEVIAGRQ